MRFRVIPLFFAFLVLSAAAALAVEVHSLGSSNSVFALDADSGNIAAVDGGSDDVRIFDAKFKPLVSHKVPKRAVWVVAKRFGKDAYFAVLSQSPSQVTLFDAAKGTKLRTVKLALDKPCMLATSADPADPRLFYTNEEGKVSVVALDTMKETATVVTGVRRFVAVSAGGNYIYYRGHNNGSEVFQCREIVNGVVSGQFSELHQMRRFCVDPFENFCVVDETVYSADMRTRLDRVPYPLLGFFPDRSAILGRKTVGSLGVLSYNEFAEQEEIRLPDNFGAVGGKPSGRGYDPDDEKYDEDDMFEEERHYERMCRVRDEMQCVMDAGRARVLVFAGEQVLVLNYSELKLPAEPHLIVRFKGERRLLLGDKMEIPIEMPNKRVCCEIKSGPEGMKIVDGKLCWEPSAAQVGTHRVALRIYVDNAQRTLYYEFVVSRPAVRLDFIPKCMLVSPDGKLILLREQMWNESGTRDRLVLLDADSGKQIAERTFENGCVYIGIDEHYVYVSVREVKVFCMLSLKDLSEQKRITCAYSILGFAHDVKGNLLVRVDYAPQPNYVYSLPDGKCLSGPPVPTETKEQRNSQSITRGQMGGGVYWLTWDLQGGFRMVDGCVYDKNGKLALVAYPKPYCSSRESVLPGMLKWNRFVSAGLGTGGSTVLLEGYPVVASIVASRPGEAHSRPSNHARVVCKIRDLVTHATLEEMVLMDERYETVGKPRFKHEIYPCIATAGGKVFVLYDNMLFTVALEPEIFKDVKPPLSIVPQVESCVMPESGVTTLKYKTVGERGKKRFSLPDSYHGQTLNAETGEVTINAWEYVDAILDGYIGRKDNLGRLMSMPDDETLCDKIGGGHGLDNDRFEAVTGVKVKGMLVCIKTGIGVTDDYGPGCVMEHYVFYDMPREKVLEIIRKKREAFEAKQAALNAQPKSNAELQIEIRKFRDEFKKTDARLKELEAKIESLIKLLQQQQDARKEDEEKDEESGQ